MNNEVLIKAEVQRQAKIELYKRDFFIFYKRACLELEPQTNWTFPAFIQELCSIGQQIVENTATSTPQNDCCINISPRNSKSYIFSVCLNAWAWTRFPHLKFMSISYADNLSSKFAYKTRLLIKTDWYQDCFGDVFQLSDDDNKKTAFSNDKSGTRESFGMTGSVTGSGADIILCDDLQKPSETSDTKLDNVIDVYRDTIYNRLNNPSKGGCRVNIAQRTHERDITSWILSNDEDVFHVCLPIEISDSVTNGYEYLYTNGLLWEERFGYDVLAEYKKSRFTYNTQYLQNPQPSIGILIMRDWFPIISRQDIPEIEFAKLRWEMFLDTAYGIDKADETACLIGAKWGNNVLIKKAYTWYLEFPALVRKTKDIYNLQNCNMCRIEPKANGLSLIQTLKAETQMNVMATESPKDSKIIRVTNITPNLESGRVFLLNDSSVDLQMQQYTSFPNSSHDGLVDVLYYCTKQFINKNQGMTYRKG